MPFLGVVGARLVSGGDRLGLRVGHRVSLRALGPWGAPSPHPNALAHHTEAAFEPPFLSGPSRSRRGDPRSKTEVFQFQKPSDFSLFLAVSRLNWTHKKRWSGVLGPAEAPGLRRRSAGRSFVQWKSVRLTLPPSTLPCPPSTSRELPPHSPRLWEKAQAGKEPRPSRDPKSGPAGLEQWSGKLVKRFFSPPHILLSSCPGPQPL